MSALSRSLKRRVAAVLAGSICLLCVPDLITAGPPSVTASQLVKAADRSRNGWAAFVVDVEITNYKGEKVDAVSSYQVFIKGSDKSLVKFQDPVDKGKFLLMTEDFMWFYLPSASRPIRISPLQRLSGNASNGDVAQLSLLDNYSASLLPDGEAAGKPAYVVDLVAKRESATYQSVRYWISQDSLLPQEAEFRLTSGKPSKKVVFAEYEKVDGRTLLRRQVIYDLLRKGEKTVLDFRKYSPRDLPDKMFNKNYLHES